MEVADNKTENEFEDEFAKFAEHAKSKEGNTSEEVEGEEVEKEVEETENKQDADADIASLDDDEEEKEDEEQEKAKEPKVELEDLNAQEAPKAPKEPTEQDAIIKTLMKELETIKSKPKYASPVVEKINEYISNGGKLTKEFWELQSKDYSNVDLKNEKSALEVLKDKMKYEEELDDSTIEKILRKEYPILTGRKEEGEYDDDEKDDESVSLIRNAKNALPSLKEIQNKAKLPNVDNDRKERIEHANNLYRAQSREATKDYQGLIIELDDTLKVRSSPSEKTRQFINSVVTEPKNQGDTFFNSRYINKEGRIDYDKFASEMQLLDEWKDISRKVYQQGLKRGEKKAISRELQQQPNEAKASNPKGVHGSKSDWAKNASATIEKAFSI